MIPLVPLEVTNTVHLNNVGDYKRLLKLPNASLYSPLTGLTG